MERDGGRYYGPFTSAYAVRQTLDVLRRVFPYLDCSREITGRDPKPCLYYHIKRCAGPCIGAVDREGYRQIIAGLGAFLEGDSEGVLAQLAERMQVAAEHLQFERAALLRDQIRAATQIVERQKVVSGSAGGRGRHRLRPGCAHRRSVRAGLLHPPRQADRP